MEPKKTTRIDYLRDIFLQDYKKAIKKNKLLDMRTPEFNGFVAKLGESALQDIKRMAAGNSTAAAVTSALLSDHNLLPFFVDPAFFAFAIQSSLLSPSTSLKYVHEEMFDFFVEQDPTPHKEYLQWFVNNYRDLIKQRKPFRASEKTLDVDMLQDGSFREMLLGGAENRFFEDFFKVSDALNRYTFLKKTKVIMEKDKDINRFESFAAFLKMLKPFLPAEEGSNDVDTLDHKELKAIENQIQYERGELKDKEEPRAELVFQDDNWVIIWTINKEANQVFGKYTTWCTAGTRYNSMFDRYDKDGKLFVMIRKGKGSKKAIDLNASVRLQFHFESKQYMDANDKPINIKKFLDENSEIKKFYRDYIVKSVLPKKGGKYEDHVKLLMELGYGDELIKIYKEVQPEEIEIRGFKLSSAVLEEIGDIKSLQRLTLSDIGLTKLPDSIKNLKKLKYLCCSSNDKLTEFPSWINELSQLTDLHFSECDIRNEIDLSGLTNLEQITFDFNNNLTYFPKGLKDSSRLRRVCMSNCKLTEINDDILSCTSLYLVDVHNNNQLSKIPLGITKLPELGALCIDDTAISREDEAKMERNKIGNCDIIRFT